MLKSKSNLVLAALLAGFSSVAMAEGSGFYGAVDLGQAKQKDSCTGAPAGVSCTATATAFRIGGGYQLNPNVGLEVSYGDYGAAKASGPALGPVSLSLAATGFQVSAVGSLPVSDAFAFTGKIGVANTTLKTSASALGLNIGLGSTSTTTLAYGIGVRYNLTPTIALRAQYEDLGKMNYPGGVTGKTGLSLISAGVTFGF
ncbi:MAG: outer membrane beta-barrel protein [Nitrosomonadales bacterium]|nr:outer membrane beta-barrel protein [Nitrosomonadales bacterium]